MLDIKEYAAFSTIYFTQQNFTSIEAK